MDTQTSSSTSNNGVGGIAKPWALVLLFTVVVILFIPPMLSSSFHGVHSPIGVTDGWDAFNFVLVLFAILCGLFARRRRSFTYYDRSPIAANTSTPRNQWLCDEPEHSYHSSLSSPLIQRMRCSVSYNDDDDVEQLNWGRATESQSFRESETRTIPVDTCVLRRSPSPVRSGSPSPTPAQRLSRRRSLPSFPEVMVEDNLPFQPSSPQPPAPAGQLHRRRRSAETVAMDEENKKDYCISSPTRKAETEACLPSDRINIDDDDLPSLENSKDTKFNHDQSQMTAASKKPKDEKKSHKKQSSGAAANGMASSILSFYQKTKKGSSKMKMKNDSNSSMSRPPPPPSALFYQLFPKKGGGKGQRIHSASPPPPPQRRLSNKPTLSQHLRNQYSQNPQMRPNMQNIGNVVEGGVKEERSAAAAVFCPSPDVNNKAEVFIARFRAGLKLEKLNSIREKVRQGEEFMMVGSIVDDDS